MSAPRAGPATDGSSWSDHAHAPPIGTELCRFAEIENGAVKEFRFGEGRYAFRMIVVRFGDDVAGYVNCCPHFQIALNTAVGDFLTVDHVLWCGQHYAQFRFEDGYCIEGPCMGGVLDPVPVSIDESRIIIG